jgi:predicted nucleic acid-binding protein
MTKVFLDTDIIPDFLGDQKPFSQAAIAIFLAAYNKQIALHTSANSITTAYYILSKLTSEKHARELITGLLEHIAIIPVRHSTLKNAFTSSFKDVEDSVQYYTASTISDMHCIITRNVKDYKKSTLNVITSDELLKFSTHGRTTQIRKSKNQP